MPRVIPRRNPKCHWGFFFKEEKHMGHRGAKYKFHKGDSYSWGGNICSTLGGGLLCSRDGQKIVKIITPLVLDAPSKGGGVRISLSVSCWGN